MTEAVEPDALNRRIGKLEDAFVRAEAAIARRDAALVALRGERDEALAERDATRIDRDEWQTMSEANRDAARDALEAAELYADKAFTYEGETVDLSTDNAALAASLDRVRAEVAWLADLVRAHRLVEGIFAQRVILHEIVTAIEAAAALSPGEGNGNV